MGAIREIRNQLSVEEELKFPEQGHDLRIGAMVGWSKVGLKLTHMRRGRTRRRRRRQTSCGTAAGQRRCPWRASRVQRLGLSSIALIRNERLQ